MADTWSHRPRRWGSHSCTRSNHRQTTLADELKLGWSPRPVRTDLKHPHDRGPPTRAGPRESLLDNTLPGSARPLHTCDNPFTDPTIAADGARSPTAFSPYHCSPLGASCHSRRRPRRLV